MTMPKKTTQAAQMQRILDHLAKAKHAAAWEVAEALKMSPRTARKHLKVLFTNGRVDRTYVYTESGDGAVVGGYRYESRESSIVAAGN